MIWYYLVGWENGNNSSILGPSKESILIYLILNNRYSNWTTDEKRSREVYITKRDF